MLNVLVRYWESVDLIVDNMFSVASPGLVSHVVPADDLVDSALETAQKIASYSPIAVKLTKECINQAYETTLSTGEAMEKRFFHSTWATV